MEVVVTPLSDRELEGKRSLEELERLSAAVLRDVPLQETYDEESANETLRKVGQALTRAVREQ